MVRKWNQIQTMNDSDHQLSGRLRTLVSVHSGVRNLAIASLVLFFQACTNSSDRVEFSRASTLASTCAACHGTTGNSALEDIPSLAGEPAESLLEKIQTYRGDEFGSTSMHYLMRGYSEEELEKIADYFANMKSEGGQ